MLNFRPFNTERMLTATSSGVPISDGKLRKRSAHLNHFQVTGLVEMAGPVLDEAGQMFGSLIILEVVGIQAARDWAAADVGTALDPGNIAA